MTTNQERCIECVYSPGAFTGFRCSNRAKYGAYCGVHSPEKQAERAVKRGPTQWERECAIRDARAALLDAVLEAARGMVANRSPGDSIASSTARDRLDAALNAYDAGPRKRSSSSGNDR